MDKKIKTLNEFRREYLACFRASLSAETSYGNGLQRFSYFQATVKKITNLDENMTPIFSHNSCRLQFFICLMSHLNASLSMF